MVDIAIQPCPATRSGLAKVWGKVVGVSRRSPTSVIGLVIILIFGLMALFAPLLMPYDPIATNSDAILHGPSAAHWFGTDGNGMDVLSRVIYGSRYAFGIAIPVVIVALSLGIPIGLYSGYKGGNIDEAIMRVVDAFRVFPSIILALAVVAAWKLTATKSKLPARKVA